MHSTFWSIAAFDFSRRLRTLSMWVYFALFTVLAALWTASAAGAFAQVSVNFGGDKVLVDGPYALMIGMAVIGFLGVMVIGSITGRAVQQDFEAIIHHFFFSAPISKAGYFFGRLSGAYLSLAIVFVGIGLGVLIGVHWPGVDPARVVASPEWQTYLRPYLFVLIPNMLWLGGCFFVLAALTRQMAPVYVCGVLVLVGYLFALNLLGDMDNRNVAALIDPSGATAVDVMTRYWSVAQKNGEPLPLAGVFLANRAIWVGLGVLVTLIGFLRFRMSAVASSGRRSRTQSAIPAAERLDPIAATSRPVAFPDVAPDRSNPAYLRMLPGLARLYLGEILRSPRFLTIVLAGVLMVVGNSFTLGSWYGTNTYPITYKVLDVVGGLFGAFVLIVTAIYTGELVWREREARMDDIGDSMPAPTWLPFGAKFLAILGLQLTLLLVVMICSIGVQLAHGFFRIDLGEYLFELFVLQFSGYVLSAVLALTVHTLVNNKYLGHFVVGLVFLVLMRLPDFNVEDKLYLYASRPSIVFSDMNGYGHFLPAFFWFRLYWWAFAVLMVMLSYALWVRGRERSLKHRLAGIGSRLRPGFARGVIAAALVVFAGSGGWIYYNTHVLNPFVTRYDGQLRAAQYERKYRQFHDAPQPRIAAVDMKVDLSPERNMARVAGSYRLVNRTAQPIQDVYLLWNWRVRSHEVRFAPAATLVDEDPDLYWHHYRLDSPLAPAAEASLEFAFEYGAVGFTNEGASPVVLGNGTFLNGGESALQVTSPSLGYAEDGELRSDRDRKRFDLPPRERMAPLDDPIQVNQNALSRDADFIDYRAQVCTAADQLPITSGYVERDWTERDAGGGERHCIAYAMDSKMANIYSFVSARYTVKRDVWHGPDGDVAIEIDYDPAHPYNVDRMIDGVKDSLAYYTQQYGPYQHRIVRILEFPRAGSRGGFAESFPNTVPFSEAIGFTAKVDDQDPSDIDYPYFVTAHEVAHQWWAHQEMPANVQGAEFTTESLAEYSALMVLKHRYGDERMRRFLKYELDGYLNGRGTEQKAEQPLVKADGAAYVHYQKGSLVLYALQDIIGEAAMSDALSAFVRRWHFAGPPYARSTDLLAELRRVTPGQYRPLIKSFFETITLYDLRAIEAKATPRQDGRTDIELRVSARQIEADGGGAEMDVPFDTPVDIGVLDDAGRVLAIGKHRLQTGENRFTLTVEGKPARAGIDPLDKLIDRDQSDNAMPVSQ